MFYMCIDLQKSGGFIAVVSGQLIVCGSYSSAMSPSVCVEALEMMGERAWHTLTVLT